MRDPLVAPMAAIAFGVLLARYCPFAPRDALLGIAAFSLLTVIAIRRGAPVAGRIACLLALALTGVLACAVHAPEPAPVLDTGGDDRNALLAGCVVEPPVRFDGREQFTLELAPGARVRVSLFLAGGETSPGLRYGQRVEVEARVRHPHNFGNPGAFDRVRYLARRDIYWTATSRPGRLRVEPGDCGSPAARLIANTRDAALDRISALYAGHPYETAMLRALLFGDASQLEQNWREEFRLTGTIHALVISGSHVSILAAVLLAMLRLVFVPRRHAALATAIAAWGYALLTGWQAPVVRSAAGFSLFLIASLVFRRGRILNALAAAGIAFLLLDPEQLFEASFQLSFLAVAFLGTIASPLLDDRIVPAANALHDLANSRHDPGRPAPLAAMRLDLRLLAQTISMWTHLPRAPACRGIAMGVRVLLGAAAIFLTSAIVQAGLALPMAIYFHRVSLTGLTANLLVVPLIAVIVPLGFAALATGWPWVIGLTSALLAATRGVVHAHAAFEPHWRVPPPPPALALAVAAALALAAITWQRGRGWRIASGALVAACLTVVLAHPFAARTVPGVLEVTAIDVGQGDGLFIAFPGGATMLVDTGGLATFGKNARPPRLDIGEDVVSPYLWTRSIRSIDIVALTHAHADHLGGAAAILDNFRVGELWTGSMPDVPAWAALRAKATARGVRIVAPREGDVRAIGTVIVTTLAPLGDYRPGDLPANNDSLALHLRFGRRAFLLTGDLERQIESQLAPLPADVLKVGHHGSKTSTTPELLDTVRPSIALISAGFENNYRHPHPDILKRLAERGVMVLRTDVHGLVTIRTDGNRLEASAWQWSEHSPALEPAGDR